MNRFLKKIGSIVFALGLITILYSGAWAMNSLVKPGDMDKMKDAKIGSTVIQLITTEQTSSVTPDFLIKLKKSGADDAMLQQVILADRYKNPTKANLSENQTEILKKAGYSDEMIANTINASPTRRVVDEKGNESIVYGTGVTPPKESTANTQPPSTVNVNIERLGVGRR